MENTGSAIVIATCLYLSKIYGWETSFVIFIILACGMWLHTPTNAHEKKLRLLDLEVEFKELECKKLTNELEQ